MDAGRHEFRFVVNGVNLPEEREQKIAAAIYRAAVGALADLDFDGDSASFFIGRSGKFDWRWAGGAWGPLDQLEGAADVVGRWGG